VAHNDIAVFGGAEVAHGGDAALERLACVLLGEKDCLGAAPPALLRPGLRSRRLVPEVGHVRVHIDQTGHAGQRTQVNDLRASRNRARAGTDTRYAVAPYDHDRVVEDTSSAIDQPREADRCGLRRDTRRGKTERENRASEDLE